MSSYPPSIKKALEAISRLPGLGPKTAERITFYLLKKNNPALKELTDSLHNLQQGVSQCQECYNISIGQLCQICQDKKRQRSTICVVAEPPDLLAIEKTGDFQGVYHVLGGVVNAIEQITPDKLKIKELLSRASQPEVKEVILALNADLEGETTSLLLFRELKKTPVKVTRLAKGLPMGSDLEYADEMTISSALRGRQMM